MFELNKWRSTIVVFETVMPCVWQATAYMILSSYTRDILV